MITKRIIPCLDVKDGRVVKGVNFQKLGDVASPVELAKYYSENGADELVFYDITASAEGRALFTDILTETARTVFIPLTVGGGINTTDDFDRTLAYKSPAFSKTGLVLFPHPAQPDISRCRRQHSLNRRINIPQSRRTALFI